MTQLRDYRKRAGLTLRDMAELTGFHLNMVRRHECGINKPNAVQMELYRKASGGAVTVADWARLQKRRAEPAITPKETETVHE